MLTVVVERKLSNHLPVERGVLENSNGPRRKSTYVGTPAFLRDGRNSNKKPLDIWAEIEYNGQLLSLRMVLRDLINSGAFNRFSRRVCRGSFEIYIVLTAASPDGEQVEITLQEIVNRTTFSIAKVVDCLRALEKAGLVKRTIWEKPGRPQVYTLYKGRALNKVMR